MTKLGMKRKEKQKPIKKKLPKLYSLDNLFSRLVRMRAGNKCEYCGKEAKKLACHHGVVHRRYRNTRYELDNCASVCTSCHWFLGDFPRINSEFFKKRIGSDRVEQLEILAHSKVKPDLEKIKAELEEKIKVYEL